MTVRMAKYFWAAPYSLLGLLFGLFATLDATTRRMELPGGEALVLTDTVGFIRDLPHDLVASFRATLEEIEGSDLLVHLVDAAHPGFPQQIDAVLGILRDLGYQEIPRLTVFNKIDLVPDEEREGLVRRHGALAISATTRSGIEAFLRKVDAMLPLRSRREAAAGV